MICATIAQGKPSGVRLMEYTRSVMSALMHFITSARIAEITRSAKMAVFAKTAKTTKKIMINKKKTGQGKTCPVFYFTF